MLNLTAQEKHAILFLLTVSLVGLGAQYAARSNSKIAKFVRISNEITKLDINKASFEDLVSTRAIPQGLAKKIIEYRLAQGPFKDLEETRHVKGIGPKRFEKLKEYLFVE